jgi:hypothetical protein
MLVPLKHPLCCDACLIEVSVAQMFDQDGHLTANRFFEVANRLPLADFSGSDNPKRRSLVPLDERARVGSQHF